MFVAVADIHWIVRIIYTQEKHIKYLKTRLLFKAWQEYLQNIELKNNISQQTDTTGTFNNAQSQMNNEEITCILCAS